MPAVPVSITDSIPLMRAQPATRETAGSGGGFRSTFNQQMHAGPGAGENHPVANNRSEEKRDPAGDGSNKPAPAGVVVAPGADAEARAPSPGQDKANEDIVASVDPGLQVMAGVMQPVKLQVGQESSSQRDHSKVASTEDAASWLAGLLAGAAGMGKSGQAQTTEPGVSQEPGASQACSNPAVVMASPLQLNANEQKMNAAGERPESGEGEAGLLQQSAELASAQNGTVIPEAVSQASAKAASTDGLAISFASLLKAPVTMIAPSVHAKSPEAMSAEVKSAEAKQPGEQMLTAMMQPAGSAEIAASPASEINSLMQSRDERRDATHIITDKNDIAMPGIVDHTKTSQDIMMEQPAISTAVQAPGSTMAARLADQVVWLRNQHIQVAELRLHPRDLGSLQIRIDHNNEGTQIQFVAPHQHVRDVLDQNLVQLKEMFRDAGINLVQVNVSAEQRDHAGRGQQGMDDVTLRGSRQQSTQAENDAGDEAMEVLGVSRLGGSSPYQLDFYI